MNTDTESLKSKGIQNKVLVLIVIGLAAIITGLAVGTTDNPIGIGFLLIGLFIFLLGLFHRFGITRDLSFGKQVLYWAPRVLCITFAGFICIFALDVFSESKNVWQLLLGLLMHLIPTFLLIIILLLSWHREWIGGILFTGLGLLYLAAFRGRMDLLASVVFALPLMITGILFLFNWRYREELGRKKV